MIGCYFPSWSSAWTSKKEQVDIKDVEADIVYISFAQPDCKYTKGSFQGTGLSFSSDFEIVAGACELLKDSKTIMLSVGGGTYHGWDNLNVDALVQLADDLHCKGIDIDWEPQDGAASSEKMSEIITAFRDKYSGYLSFATAHVGAYGHGKFENSQPVSLYTGCNYPGLVDCGHKLDWINVMAYDAGHTFDPLECYDSYKQIFHKKIYMGIEIGDQAWGGVVTTLSDVEKLYQYIHPQGDELFVWSWKKPGPFTVQDIIQTTDKKRSIDQVDEPITQPEKPKDTTPTLPIPPLPPFIPSQPQVDPKLGKEMWEPGMKLNTGDLVFYNSATYKVRAGHLTSVGWEPDVAIVLFMRMKDPNCESWVNTTEYHKGEFVNHNGKRYECLFDHVSQIDWQPGMVGLWR